MKYLNTVLLILFKHDTSKKGINHKRIKSKHQLLKQLKTYLIFN
jgi:hypothetical protein